MRKAAMFSMSFIAIIVTAFTFVNGPVVVFAVLCVASAMAVKEAFR